MEKQSLERKQEEQSPERKYAELTSYIRILSYRASNEQNEKSKEVSKRLMKLATYLDEVRKQRHLCMLLENDRIERVRFKEILNYIDETYDGSENSTKEICKVLDRRDDIEEVLKYHRKEQLKKEKEAER